MPLVFTSPKRSNPSFPVTVTSAHPVVLLRHAAVLGLGVLLTACAEFTPRPQPQVAFEKSRWTHAPAWANAALQQDWWTSYRDPRLNRHIATALHNNADLAVLAARLEQAGAQTLRARAAAWPTLTVGAGYRDGREQTRETGFRPDDLLPWAATARTSWELDLSGKLRAATSSARENRTAAFWDLHAARLLVATGTAEAHFRILRLNEEHRLVGESVRANRRILTTLRQREAAGLISTTELRRQEGEHQRLERALLDLDRLRGIARLQLATLLGSTTVPSADSRPLRDVAPTPLPVRTTTAVLRHRPDLLAAEARVRSAFQQEEAARLNLLPSLRIGAAAQGAAGSLTTNLNTWIASVGPTLEIPVWDPRRLAQVRVDRAATNEAAAAYRAAVLDAFEDVERSYLNSANRRRQLAAAQREVTALDEARRNTLATFNAGIVSQIELLESERRTLEAHRQELAVRHALLRDHLALTRALGGSR